MAIDPITPFDLARIPDVSDQANFHLDATYVFEHLSQHVVPKFNANFGWLDQALVGDAGSLLALMQAHTARGDIHRCDNHLINSGFEVSERGDFSTATPVVNGVYYWDRWQASTDVTAELIEDQHYQGSKTVKLTANSAIAVGQLVLDQRFEFPSRYAGQLVTVSVPVWSNSDKAHVNIYDSGFNGLKSEAHAGDGNMQLLKVTGILNANLTDLRVRIGLSEQGNTNIASGDYFRFGKPKFELASDASPYEIVPISQTKQDCLRFFERVGSNYEAYANLSTWLYDSAYGTFFHSPKRATPAISHGGVPGDYRFRSKGENYTVTGFDFTQMQSDRFRMGVTLLGGPSAGNGGWLSHISGTTFFDVDAEIYG